MIAASVHCTDRVRFSKDHYSARAAGCSSRSIDSSILLKPKGRRVCVVVNSAVLSFFACDHNDLSVAKRIFKTFYYVVDCTPYMLFPKPTTIKRSFYFFLCKGTENRKRTNQIPVHAVRPRSSGSDINISPASARILPTGQPLAPPGPPFLPSRERKPESEKEIHLSSSLPPSAP